MDPKEEPPPEPVLRAQQTAAPEELGFAADWLLPDLPLEEDSDDNLLTDADLAPDAVDAAPAEFDELDDRYETLDDPRIPDGQSYFKIGEVAKIIGVKPYVLRYWEGEF